MTSSKKERKSVIERAYDEYLESREKYTARTKWGTKLKTPLSAGKHFGKKRFHGALANKARFKETAVGGFSQASPEATLPFWEFEIEVEARIAGLKGGERQRAARYTSRWLAARQAGVLTQTEAIKLKQLATGQNADFPKVKVNGAENWSVREMMRDRSYLSLIYEQLKENGALPDEAWKVIGREVFGSD